MVSARSLGLTLIALGIANPVMAYVAGYVFNSVVVSYGGPPNQGAMVLAYLLIRGALALGACLALMGFVLMIKTPRKPIRNAR